MNPTEPTATNGGRRRVAPPARAKAGPDWLLAVAPIDGTRPACRLERVAVGISRVTVTEATGFVPAERSRPHRRMPRGSRAAAATRAAEGPAVGTGSGRATPGPVVFDAPDPHGGFVAFVIELMDIRLPREGIAAVAEFTDEVRSW